MKTLAMLASPGTWSAPGLPLVGRTVANAAFLRALLEHSSFEEVALFIGETADLPALEKLTDPWDVDGDRLAAYSLWQLPELLARGRIDVFHHASHADRLFDLIALRDRFSSKGLPVTGQTHSLSYPRFHQELSRLLLVPPSPGDALFCSSTAGRTFIEKSFERFGREAQTRGFTGPLPSFALPQVPLGVDATALVGGRRELTREALKIPTDAVVITCLARFTEHDKVDLFPVLRVFERLVSRPMAGAPPVYLLLAGARQGTKTPEMLELWARHLGVADRLRLKVDFADDEKRDLLAASDVFVSPIDNVQETFGQSVIEAMAAGLPVVVSDFDGYKDTVPGSVGIRVATRIHPDWSELSELGPLLYERPLHLTLGQSVEVDLQALESALRFLVVNPEQRKEMGAAARAHAHASYDWKVVIRRYESEWKRLALLAKKPQGTPHPLQLDYAEFFGHFASQPPMSGADTKLVLTERADDFVIYPELKHLFVEDDVKALIHEIHHIQPCTHRELVDFMKTRLVDRRPWVASFVVGWMRKHGLVRPG